MVPTVEFPLAIPFTDQSTATIELAEAVAVQLSVLPEETVEAGFPEESLQITELICVAAMIVSVAVAVRVD
jgi:hypothetical protein